MLSDIASIATLILFVIYFVGRVITIIIEKNIKYERIERYGSENEIPRDLKIIDDFKCNEISQDILIIIPTTKSYNWVKIYECNYNEKKNRLVKTKKIYNSERIYNDHALRIDTIITCGIPNYILEFERCDYMKGELILQENGKNGIEEELLVFKHTLKSILYYLFR